MTDPRLYILMRTDLASMNPGKGMAQAAHAANAFIHEISAAGPNYYTPQMYEAVAAWQDQTTQGFGTTLTLAVEREDDIYQMVEVADGYRYPANVLQDPTYPVQDGKVTHLLPITTCGYVFSPDGSPWFLSTLPLHP